MLEKIYINDEKKGELIMIIHSILWSLLPVVTLLAYGKLTPLFTLAFSVLLSCIFFSVVITKSGKWREIYNGAAYKDILLTTLILGIGYYLLIFIGLKYTSPVNVSIITLSETFFSYLLFNRWFKEYYSITNIVASIMMIIGAFIVLVPSFNNFYWGDFLILAAAAIAPFGNYFQRRARKKISSEMILFLRSLITAPIVAVLAYFVGEKTSISEIKSSLIFLLINGFLLLGFTKILWVEGIHRISVTKANTICAVTPLFTLIFTWFLLHQPPTIWQLLSLIPISLGMMLLNYRSMEEQKKSF